MNFANSHRRRLHQHSRHHYVLHGWRMLPQKETQVCPLSMYHTNPKKNITICTLHVLPVLCDGGFSRYVLLSLAMLWNQLNYITTSTYLTVQVHDLINLFRNAFY
jgi:hypothetical protein